MSGTGTLSWRPIKAEDVPACAVLLATIEEADQTGDVFGEEDLLETFRDPGRDYPRGSACVHAGDVMVGYCCLSSSGSADQVHQMSQYGGVHPAYRRQGIGGRLDWAQLAAVPLHEERYPGLPLSMSGWSSAGDSGESALYASRGFRPARWFHLMAADLTAAGPGAPVPAGVQVAAFTAELAEDARLVRNEAFRDHWQASQSAPGEWAHFLSYNSFRPAFSYLAYDGAEPLGILISHEYDAYTELTGILDLYIALAATRQSARKRGIASALLSRALADARSAGFTAASLRRVAGSAR
jgi:mycothiol synthase